MTEDDLRAIAARCEAATPGPWLAFLVAEEQDGIVRRLVPIGGGEGHWTPIVETPEDDARDADIEFIAHARADVPALIAEVRLLQSMYDDLLHISQEACQNARAEALREAADNLRKFQWGCTPCTGELRNAVEFAREMMIKMCLESAKEEAA